MAYRSPQKNRTASRNPAFRGNIFESTAQGYMGVDRMTVEGTLGKCLFLIVLAILAAGAEVALIRAGGSLGQTFGVASFVVGFVLSLVTIFKPTVSPITSPIYAVLEGFALGFISYAFEASYPGVVLPAIGMTLFSALAMLVLYRSQVIRVTPMFARMVIFATIAIMLTYGAAIVASLFGVHFSFLTQPTVLGIAFSLFVVGLACMNLILDFDFIAKGATYGSPKYMEWYGAFSLLVTLVWLYLEFLRLLAKLQR